MARIYSADVPKLKKHGKTQAEAIRNLLRLPASVPAFLPSKFISRAFALKKSLRETEYLLTSIPAGHIYCPCKRLNAKPKSETALPKAKTFSGLGCSTVAS